MKAFARAVAAVVAVGWLTAVAPAAAQPAFTAVGPPVATGDNPLSIAFSPDGSLLAVANQNDGTLSVYSVGARGALTPVSGSPFPTQSSPDSVAFDPAGPLIAVANASSNSVSVFIYSGTTVAHVGSFDTTNGTASGTDPRSVAFDPSGNLVVTADGGGSGAISVLRVGQNATLASVTGSPFAATNVPAALAFDGASEEFATADQTAGKATVYALGADGTVHPGQSVTAGTLPHSVAFSRDGTRLAVADQSAVSLFSVSGQTLSATTPPPVPATATVTEVGFSRGSDLLAVGSTAGDTYVFSVPSMAAVPGSPFTTAASATIPAFGRAGGLIAATDEFRDQVSVFTVGPPTAAITSPAAGAAYLHNQSVTPSFSCADATAAPGISACLNSGGGLGQTGRLDTSTTGRHIYSVTASSVDGQTGTASVPYLVADAPTITLTAPIQGTSYDPTTRTRVAYTCQDGSGGLGIQSCTGTLASGAPLPTRTGSYSFTVSARSKDGLTNSETVQYTVGEPFALTSTISPTVAGTPASPVPIKAEFSWHLSAQDEVGGQLADVPPGNAYTLTLPADFALDKKGFSACPSSAIGRRQLPANCQSAVVATGSLNVTQSPQASSGRSLMAGTCAYRLSLLVAKQPAGMALRVDRPHAIGAAACLSRPVDGAVHVGGTPEKLVFPPLSSVVTNAIAVDVDLRFTSTGAGKAGRSYLDSTGCSRQGSGIGFAWITALDVGKFHTSATTTCAPAGMKPITTTKGRGQTVSGVVVHRIKPTGSFVVARNDGRLFKVASPSTLPAPGTPVTVGVKPLSYGQWAQTCLSAQSGSITGATLNGTVTAVSSKRHAFVLSASGSSILINDPHKLPPLLHDVTVVVALDGGKLVAKGVKTHGLHKGQLVIAGILKKVKKGKGGKGETVSSTTDDTGSDQGDRFTISLPAGSNQFGEVTGISSEVEPVEWVYNHVHGSSLTTKQFGKTKPPKLVLGQFHTFGPTANQLCSGG